MSKLQERYDHLQLEQSTQGKYDEILARFSGDPLAWLKSKVGPKTPIGTVLPLRAAVKHYMIAEMGFSEAEVNALLPKAKGADGREIEPLDLDQVATLLGALEQPDVTADCRCVLKLMLFTGMRIGEATALRYEMLETQVPAGAQGRAEEHTLEFTGKHGAARQIILNSREAAILEAYARETFQVDFRQHERGWLFPGRSGKKPISKQKVYKVLWRIRDAHPILSGTRPHQLRHTYATILVEQGVDIAIVQGLLGHKSIVTTKRYVTPGLAAKRKAVHRGLRVLDDL